MKTKNNVRAMTEAAIMVALSTVLSILKVAELPYGGSITVASMVPLVVLAYRHGWAWSMGAATVNALIQMLLGLKNFSYFTTWQSIVALAIFDYILAFAVFGLSGIFKKVEKRQNMAMIYGALLASILRYICHTISGATIWAGISIPTAAALIYSLGYNATYMIPETIILLLVTAYLSSALDFSKEVPIRVPSKSISKPEFYSYLTAALSVVVGLIISVVAIFKKLQDPDTGDFVFTYIRDVNWLLVIISMSVCIVIALGFFIYARAYRKKSIA